MKISEIVVALVDLVGSCSDPEDLLNQVRNLCEGGGFRLRQGPSIIKGNLFIHGEPADEAGPVDISIALSA